MTKKSVASNNDAVCAPDQFGGEATAAAMQTCQGEQRRDPRQHPARHVGMAVHFKLGCDASVVDLSAGGILVETQQRLCPGAVVVMQLFDHDCTTTVRGQVLRSAISRLLSARVWYRGAIQFASPLEWPTNQEGFTLPGRMNEAPRR
jgi:hypothetical protein